MNKRIIVILLLSITFLRTTAQEGYAERARNYVKQYAAYAIADQKATGVPASVTLGQGILETEAGLSELMVKANNHFGIKCKNNWQGETFLHTDDAKDECFKKYGCALESYNDHSAHLLRNPRYSCLFTYSTTDYARWAHGLKKCGYATNPKYAYQLIKVIEEYRLQEYTYAALDSSYQLPGNFDTVPHIIEAKPVAQAPIEKPAARDPVIPVAPADTAVPAITVSYPATALSDTFPTDTVLSTEPFAARYPSEEPGTNTEEGKIIMINGLKAVQGRKNDVLLQYAVKYKIRYAHLLEMNDLPDEPLPFDTYIYLEKKNASGQNYKHVVKAGESLLMIAQAEGMQLKRLASFNQMNQFEQPQVGAILNLKETAVVKPPVQDYTLAAKAGLAGPDTLAPVVAAATEQLSSGMSFEAPVVEPVANAAIVENASIHYEDTAKKSKTQVVSPEARPADTAAKKMTHGIVAQPFMREDPPQPQLKKPATEKEYKKGDRYYIVKRGETAFSIAKKHNITVAELLKWNDLDPQDLKSGQTIIVKQ